MAQHYPVYEKDEPKLFKSARRIVKYIDNSWIWDTWKEYDYNRIYTKEVMKLGPQYNPNGRAIKISPYNLQGKDWGDNRKRANVEVHFDIKGKITNIYYPL